MEVLDHHSGGPYTREQQEKRRQEVSRLHFEYGYSARKIAELMKVNRNTINRDLDYLYAKCFEKVDVYNPEEAIILHVQRLQTQRTRLREYLDKCGTFSERMAVERMIYEIDCKIIHISSRMSESVIRLHNFAQIRLNKWLEENKKDERYMTLFDKLRVSKKANERINKIIKEDKIQRHG